MHNEKKVCISLFSHDENLAERVYRMDKNTIQHTCCNNIIMSYAYTIKSK